MPGTISAVLSSLASNPRILQAKPSVNLFLLRYIRKFKPRRIGNDLILHSHLPPLNSPAYARFVDAHIVKKSPGPSHGQIGLTNACPQRCGFCYNRDRTGVRMDTPTIMKTIEALQEMGLVWLGLTGGEPLLCPDLAAVVAKAAEKCAVKLFTTGLGVTPALASDLKRAGLFSVSISLDHWEAETHDRGRGYPGAFAEALRAIEIFKSAGLDTGVSAVLTKDMIRTGQAQRLLDFLGTLPIDEVWLSEAKPSSRPFWKEDGVCSEADRRALVELQDRSNRNGGPVVNYLGHFEGPENFGCNAGTKMIYVDAFGEVSPCVFTPLSFGNVRRQSVGDIWADMRARFRPSSTCFANANFRLYSKYDTGSLPLPPEASRELVREASFSPPSRVHRMLNGLEEASS